MDLSATLSLRGKTRAAQLPTAEGVVSLRGDNLSLAIGNLDEQLSRYESSQSFNLIDVGAVFFAGPLGLAVTKGYNFARIFQGTAGTTTIRTLVSEWQVEHGVAHARDVAMATRANRIALQGGLDFVSGRYDQVTVAVVDAKGCVRVQQKVHGPFLNPVVEKPSALGTLTGPTRTLLRKAGRLLGTKCAVFYAGSVAPP
jgi:AsmA protein